MAEVATLIGAVGYRYLRDHSAAFAVLEALEHVDLGPEVTIEDVSYNPIAVVQWLEGEARDRFGRAILISAVQRDGRAAGAVDVYRWDGSLPAADSIQDSVADAVTGVISLPNTVIIAGHFKALPNDVAIVEIQPDAHEFGTTLTAAVAAGVRVAIEAVRQLVIDPAALDRLPIGCLPVRHSPKPRLLPR